MNVKIDETGSDDQSASVDNFCVRTTGFRCDIPVDDEKLKAFVSIVFDQSFVVTDIKIINGPKGLFVSMPSKKRKDGTFKDIAHPLNNQMRQYLEEKVLTVYRQQVASAPGASGAPTARETAGREAENPAPGTTGEESGSAGNGGEAPQS